MGESEVKIFSVCHYQDDPKKNTILKVNKFNLVKIVKKLRHVPRRSIILDPFSDKILTRDDKKNIELNGLTVIDCSWKKADSVFRGKYKTGRRLPRLLAANTVNYGKWDKLSSVESLAAALYIIGHCEEANLLLSKFSWGLNFYNLNEERFNSTEKF